MKSNSKSMVKKVFACFLSLALVLTLTPTLPTSLNVAKAQDAAGTPMQSTEQGGSDADSGIPYSGAGTGKTAAEIDAELQQKIDALEGSAESLKETFNGQDQGRNSSDQVDKGEVSKPSTVTAPLGAPVSDAASGVCKVVLGTGATTYYATLEDAITAVNAATGNNCNVYIYKSTTLNSVCNITIRDNVFIKNISDPASDAENPTKNGSADVQPVVTFAAGAQLNFTATNAADRGLSGVVFDGGNVERSTPAITNSKPGLYLRKGVSNTTAGITGVNATFRNFNNTTGSQASVIQNTGRLYIENADFTNNGNTSKVSSAIYNNGGTIKYGYGYYSGLPTMTGNKSMNGGAIYQASGSIEISGGTISENTALYDGGAIDIISGSLIISGGTISGNDSSSSGAIYLTSGSLNMSGGVIEDNYAANAFGAMYISSTATAIFSGGEITGNKSPKKLKSSRGAVYPQGASTATFSGSIKIHDNGFASSKTANITEIANVDPGSASVIKVGTFDSDARLGIYSSSTLCDKGVTFANVSSGTATSVASKLKKVFSNDINPNYLPVPTDTSGTGIKWAEGVCKVVDEVAGVQLFSSISEAVTYLGTVSDFSTSFASNSGTAKIEVLVPEVTQTATTTIDLGASKPIMLTTASPEATDGYPYLGDASVEEGRAVIKRGWEGDETTTSLSAAGHMFALNSASNVTIKNLIIDGNKDAYSSEKTKARGAFFISSSAISLALADKGWIRNSDSGYYTYTNTSTGETAYGSIVGGGIGGVSGSSSAIREIRMTKGSMISGCSSASNAGGAIYISDYANISMVEAEISNCSAAIAGAIEINWSRGASMDIKDSTIEDCTTTGVGGAIYSFASVALSGRTKLINNRSTGSYASAILMTNDAGYTPTLTIRDQVSITNNTSETTRESYGSAIYLSKQSYALLSGSIKIYGNKDSAGKETNILDSSSVNVGDKIKVATAGLNADAKIGVYSKNNAGSGATFAQTEAATSSTSTNVANLSRFINDRDSNLFAKAADSGNGIVWATSNVKVVDAVDGTQVFNTISGASNYIAGISTTDFATHFPEGSAKIEVLAETLTVAKGGYGNNGDANINTGASRPVILTTASADATDGYAYRGDTSKENGRAVITKNEARTYDGILNLGGDDSLGTYVTFENIIVDGASSSTYWSGCLACLNSGSNTTLVLGEGAYLRNGVTTGDGAICVEGSASAESANTVELRSGSTIEDCVAGGGGAIDLCDYATLIMDGGKITSCAGTSNSVINMAEEHASAIIKGDSEISGNECVQDVIFVGANATLNVEGNAKIADNLIGGEVAGAVNLSDATSKLYLSGAPTISNNVDEDENQRNVYESSAAGAGDQIVVDTAGLGSGANVGVYSVNNAKEGDVFAKIGSASLLATTIPNFRGLTNDQDATLMGRANEDASGVLWSTAYEDPTDDALTPSDMNKTGDELANLFWVLIGAGALALAIAYVANKKRMANKMSHMKHAK